MFGRESRVSGYSLMGYDDLLSRGLMLKSNMSVPSQGKVGRILNAIINKMSFFFFGDGGDYISILSCLFDINRSKVVVTTSDRLGVPVAILRYLGLIKADHLYVSIGLPTHFERLEGSNIRKNRYISVLKMINKVICFSNPEKIIIKAMVPGLKVEFIQYFVDSSVITPKQLKLKYDLISVGADYNRNLDFIIKYAYTRLDVSILLVLGVGNSTLLPKDIPPNITLIIDIDLNDVLEYISKSKIVLLPVKQNIYSGATTTLLQSMSMEKPVIVSNVQPLDKYGLIDGVNCSLFAPNDFSEMTLKINNLLTDEESRTIIGKNAREHVVSKLDKSIFVNKLEKILSNMN